ncbi:YegP family protein [Maribacter sp. CXY002]|uniref:YegP family protein n=1 Tax=Maribacter luteocoastalis TaxID=3407671 RepID=UPI003B68460F
MIEVKKIDNQDYQFIVKSNMGKTLLESTIFPDNASLETTLSGLKDVDTSSKHFERKTNFDGKFLFTLKNEQGSIIGNSGLYSSEAGMENGIKNLKTILSQP